MVVVVAVKTMVVSIINIPLESEAAAAVDNRVKNKNINYKYLAATVVYSHHTPIELTSWYTLKDEVKYCLHYIHPVDFSCNT